MAGFAIQQLIALHAQKRKHDAIAAELEKVSQDLKRLSFKKKSARFDISQSIAKIPQFVGAVQKRPILWGAISKSQRSRKLKALIIKGGAQRKTGGSLIQRARRASARAAKARRMRRIGKAARKLRAFGMPWKELFASPQYQEIRKIQIQEIAATAQKMAKPDNRLRPYSEAAKINKKILPALRALIRQRRFYSSLPQPKGKHKDYTPLHETGRLVKSFSARVIRRK